MSTTVMKFGGTSLASSDDFHAIAESIAQRSEECVVVVSAQAGMTDDLIARMQEIADRPAVHALDALLVTGEQQSAALMAAALTAAGCRAEVVPPWLVFETDGDFGDASIDEVDATPIRERLQNGIVPVIGGFTGRAPDGRLCTLGRGGSDYTAVAIGAAIGAGVELHKADTDGIYDRDPNRHAEAVRYEVLTHEEAFSLAAHGAKVLHDKAARLALEGEVELLVRNTFSDEGGTRIVAARALETVRSGQEVEARLGAQSAS